MKVNSCALTALSLQNVFTMAIARPKADLKVVPSRKLQPSAWTKVGSDIVAPDLNLHRIDLTADGRMLVAGGNRYSNSRSFTPNGANFVMKKYDGSSWVDVDSTFTLTGNGYAPLPSISGDGNVLDIADEGGAKKKAWFWDPNTSKFISPYVFLGTNTYPYCHKISKDGSTYFFSSENPNNSYIYRYDGSSSTWVQEATFPSLNNPDLCDISADGNRVGWGGKSYPNNDNASMFYQYNLGTKEWERLTLPNVGVGGMSQYTNQLGMASLAISADGSRVVAHRIELKDGARDYEVGSEVFEWNYTGKKLERSTKTFNDERAGSEAAPHSYAISHDGKRIASRATNGQDPHVKVFEEGETAWNEILHIAAAKHVTYVGEPWDGVGLNCDGTILAFADSTKIKVYQDTDGTDTSTCVDSSLGGTRLGTDSPTLAPTPTPWDIVFSNMTADFSATSDKELVMIYQVGRGRAYEHALYAGGCENPIIITGLVSGVDYNVTDGTTAGQGGMDVLQLEYSFDKAKIASSNIWDSSADNDKIELCQVVELIEQSDSMGEMVIFQDKRNMTITFDLSASFEVVADLKEAALTSANTTTDVQDYIAAYKCDASFVKDNSPLFANDELYVCIASSSADVEIDKIETMTIKQVGADDLPVIASSIVEYLAITSEFPVSAIKHVVMTRVPSNIFSFAPGKVINIDGSVIMQLVGGSGRMLGTDTNNGGTEAATTSFDVKVALQPEASPKDVLALNSATSFASKSFIAFGMVLALTVC